MAAEIVDIKAEIAVRIRHFGFTKKNEERNKDICSLSKPEYFQIFRSQPRFPLASLRGKTCGLEREKHSPLIFARAQKSERIFSKRRVRRVRA